MNNSFTEQRLKTKKKKKDSECAETGLIYKQFDP